MLFFDQAFKLINFLGEIPGIYPVLPIYNSFLRACAKMQSIKNANQCLDLMERQMVGKNEVTYSELLKVCKANRFCICSNIISFLFSSTKPLTHHFNNSSIFSNMRIGLGDSCNVFRLLLISPFIICVILFQCACKWIRGSVLISK